MAILWAGPRSPLEIDLIERRMSTKREERRERAEAEKLERERRQRRKVLRSRVAFIVGALILVAFVLLVRRQRQTPSDGRVWSAAHGHWHDRNGMEIRR